MVVDHAVRPPYRDRRPVLGGRAIRAGDKVVLWWAAANRDPAVFSEPDRFDIGRDPNPHLAFGYGGHACVGAGLARRELRLLFAALAERVTTIDVLDEPVWRRSNKHTGLRQASVRLR